METTPGDVIPGSGFWGQQSATFDTFHPVLETGQVYDYLAAGATMKIPTGVDVSELANQTPRGWLILNMDNLHREKMAPGIKIVGRIS